MATTRLKAVTTVKGKPALKRMMRIEAEDGTLRIDPNYAPLNVEYGGFGQEWTEIERYGRPPLVVSTGYKNRTMSFDLDLTDPREFHQHINMDTIRQLADSGKRVRITYSGRFDNRLWRITDLSFSSEKRRPTDSAIVHAIASISLIIANDANISVGPVSGGVKPSSSAKPAVKKPTSSSSSKSKAKRYYTVKSGDTLSGIAIKYYRNASKWRQIADANHIKNANVIYPGRKLLIP